MKPTAISSTFIIGLCSSCYANSTYHFIICKQTKNYINNLIQSIHCIQTIHSFTKPIVHIKLFHLFKTKTQSIVQITQDSKNFTQNHSIIGFELLLRGMITNFVWRENRIQGFIFFFCRIWKFSGLEVQG